MKRPLLLLFVLLSLAGPRIAQAQSKYITKVGRVSFFSTSIIENIEAHNSAAAAVFDLSTSQVAFSIPVKEFVFKRTLMQEHFNENYMESEKYPRATFTGRFSGTNATVLGTAGAHTVQVEGDITLHGVTHHITAPGTLELKNGQLLASALFSVAPSDYNIQIPLLVRENIAKIVDIRVALTCNPIGGITAPVSRSDTGN